MGFFLLLYMIFGTGRQVRQKPGSRVEGKRLYPGRQLAGFAADTRPDKIMHRESIILTAQQISDIAVYLAAQ